MPNSLGFQSEGIGNKKNTKSRCPHRRNHQIRASIREKKWISDALFEHIPVNGAGRRSFFFLTGHFLLAWNFGRQHLRKKKSGFGMRYPDKQAAKILIIKLPFREKISRGMIKMKRRRMRVFRLRRFFVFRKYQAPDPWRPETRWILGARKPSGSTAPENLRIPGAGKPPDPWRPKTAESPAPRKPPIYTVSHRFLRQL